MKQIIIDTREPFEFAASHVKGAVNIPPMEFMKPTLPKKLADIEKDDEIVLYCRSGARSNTVGHILRQHGFTNIVNGINENHVKKLLAARG
ncbi:TPA: hypothetical protein DIV49_00955 [Candidatus Saccharibacteria bacterium]|nr:hypothetical protein [Candidatus Saccharibacteria bacterium]HRF28830.1 rhodanese-like domain-containing protein [Candidatus Saccharibacteria bacterium]HRJ91049.1 rhodanese-like domain-containing protein [Candidatus Saccharibacteria bacterium]